MKYSATQLVDSGQDFNEINVQLRNVPAQERVAWAIDQLPRTHVLSSSFGIQSAVMLHMVTSVHPNMPVICVDTGYLFDETHQFIESLTQYLSLNLKIYKLRLNPTEIEDLYGKLWLEGKEGLERYNQIAKVEPMQRALKETGAQTWFSGLRAQQSKSRQGLSPLEKQGGRYKVLPILEWSNKELHWYLKKHKLPYHP